MAKTHKFTLIATRVAPGDNWRLQNGDGENIVYKGLTNTLEAYMNLTSWKGDYKLAPLKGELYIINEEEVETPKEKTYGIYGEHSQNL